MLTGDLRRNPFACNVHLFTTCRAHIYPMSACTSPAWKQTLAGPTSASSTPAAGAFIESYDQSPIETSTSQGGQ